MASLKMRNGSYYAQYYIGTKQKRKNLHTDDLQLAKEELRKVESALYRGAEIPLPTRTPLPQVVEEYVTYLHTVKKERNAQKIVSYLRQIFGPICPGLKVRNDKISKKAVKRKEIRPVRPIEAAIFEQITTAEIAGFIESLVRNKGIKGKTANRYREILVRLYNWATSQRNIRLPGDKNPAAQVERHKELDIEITFLTLKDIDAQLAALSDNSFMKVMVAVYIFAGLRREEAMWLTVHDIDLKTGNYGVIKVRAKTINGESWEPKTGKNRMVPISSRLRGYLDRYTPAASEGNWFFPSSARTRLDPDNFSEDLREINRKKGLSWSCGDYRHTFGSQLAMANESLFKISTLMGNSPDVCRKHYAALMPESLFQSVEFPESPTGKPEPKPLPEPEPEKVIFNETRKPVLRLVVNNR